MQFKDTVLNIANDFKLKNKVKFIQTPSAENSINIIPAKLKKRRRNPNIQL